MAIYHNHHIVPRHMGGTDNPSNLVRLTVEEHAEAHYKLYEEHGKREDYIAWKCLIGQMQMGELLREKARLGGRAIAGKPRTRTAPVWNKVDFYCIGCRKKDKPSAIANGHITCHREKKPPTNKRHYHCIGCRSSVPPSKIHRHNKCFRTFFTHFPIHTTEPTSKPETISKLVCP